MKNQDSTLPVVLEQNKLDHRFVRAAEVLEESEYVVEEDVHEFFVFESRTEEGHRLSYTRPVYEPVGHETFEEDAKTYVISF